MNNLSLTQNESGDKSLFESIRRIDENKREYWTARELMPLLEYARWDRVPDVIDRAMTACKNAQNEVAVHFSEETRKTSGRPQQDFKLSRYACYLVAMNCDPRKPAVAQAQTYFAVKTREAEVAIPAISEQLQLALLENENLKLKVKLSDNDRYLIDKSEAIVQMHGAPMLALIQGRPDAVVEKIEKVTETIVLRDGRSVSFEGKSTAQVGKELGFRTGKDFERWLDKVGHGDLICQGLRVNQTPYIPTENLATIKRVWQENRSKTRQLLIGE